ncbi:aldose 1-epimerase [Pseudooceanicola batsensis HTCC2597]|uniref:Aldose 1-epimerase n=1 Tax=Pseudooceanicola batsensis (strain ATCC BAA-863 / DSM 15984 / KCTC 12145 / HTCC2597) TaxID=252305 RepID=A3TWS4_PSEBH|nr:aldose epimerase family protein [Pseudooceanicola batsensis]EAQ03284.1 aldose 1-epimerase [Pseudooceanicola batsensis HTCC2597]
MSGGAPFGRLATGEEIRRWHIEAGELEAAVITWGATVQDLRYRGRGVVLGADRLEPYFDDLQYAGAIVGRFANRIGGARFDLNGTTYRTDPNFRGRHTLHGGGRGAGERPWRMEELRDDSVRLSLHLPDGDMGFPGALDVMATYSLEPPATLRVVIEARTTRATPCSFAHHGYFVLDDSGTGTRYALQIDAERYLPVDDDLIPTGEIAGVAGTPFDFRTRRPIGTSGYDHNFCLSPGGGALRRVARADSPASGLCMEVSTTEPGLQLYDGAHLRGLPRNGTPLGANPAIALEAQAWPDSPNHANFPDCILRPGSVYRSETLYSFGYGSSADQPASPHAPR